MPENYVLLERTELNASAASVTFANIPQSGYTDLKIVMSLRSTVGGGTNWDPLLYRFNSSTSGYSTKEVEGTGSAAASSSATTATSTAAGGTWGRLQDYGITTSNQTANTFSNIEFYIPNYTSSNQKSGSFDSVYETNATAAYAEMVATLHTGTSAITTLDFALKDGSFAQYSTFSLYGIAAVGTTPAIAPKASGGNIIDYDGTYWIHTFLTSGTFTPQTGLTCDYLVVAGGGAGGNYGGGGAGGLRSTVTATGGGGALESALSLTTQTYTVTVGAGGSGAVQNNPTNGSNSVFGAITSTGGGRGSFNINGVGPTNPNAGGSGGGGIWNGGAGGAASPSGQGFAGGAGHVNNSSPFAAGGGGGAGAVGQAGQATIGGNGGAGVATVISGTSVTYAGGGGGGHFNGSGSNSSGGAGGGGTGGKADAGETAGTTNTGGGGGGSGTSDAIGTNGGSGIVIIRYPAA
jgi:hypothetical protein